MQTKDEFLAAFRRVPKEIDADGKKVHILPLSPSDLREVNAKGGAEAKAALAIVRSVCTPDGERLLADADADRLGELIPNTANEDIVLEIAKLNRIGEHAKKAPSPPTTN